MSDKLRLEADAAWDSAEHNQRRAEKAEAWVESLRADLAEANRRIYDALRDYHDLRALARELLDALDQYDNMAIGEDEVGTARWFATVAARKKLLRAAVRKER